MRTLLPIVVLALLAALLAVGCDGPHASGQTTPRRLVLTGSSTIAPLAREIGRRFETLHPGVRVEVQTGGSSRGIRDARAGTADIGMASRALAPDEAGDLEAHRVADDEVAFLVHATNPIATLTTDQLRGVYGGRIRNWSALGGADAPIIVSDRPAGRSEPELVYARLGLDPTRVRADVVDGETQQAIKTVTGNPHAITYASAGAARFARDRGGPLRLVAIDGAPITRPLLLLTRRGERDPLEDAFVAYATSPAVDDLIEEQAYVPPHR